MLPAVTTAYLPHQRSCSPTRLNLVVSIDLTQPWTRKGVGRVFGLPASTILAFFLWPPFTLLVAWLFWRSMMAQDQWEGEQD